MSDPQGTEYATSSAERRGGEAWESLAAFLDLPVPVVIGMRDRGELGGAIERRAARHDPVAARRWLEKVR